MTGIVRELIAGMLAQPRPADLVSSFSQPLPVRVICAMLGVSADDLDTFVGWADSMFGDWNHDQDSTSAALAAIFDYVASLVEAKRAEPADDLVTALIAARDEDDSLSERELVMLCITLLIGGIETITNHINMSLITLMTHPMNWPGCAPTSARFRSRCPSSCGSSSSPRACRWPGSPGRT
ncbi:MAG TPA: cytochrome P450 [Streptosporangiaceae bacterium]